MLRAFSQPIFNSAFRKQWRIYIVKFDAPHLSQIFFIFMHFSETNKRLAPSFGLAVLPPLGKSWIRHWKVFVPETFPGVLYDEYVDASPDCLRIISNTHHGLLSWRQEKRKVKDVSRREDYLSSFTLSERESDFFSDLCRCAM